MTGRSERLHDEFEISIRWTAFPLHPETPEAGRSLDDLFSGRGMDIPAMLARLEATALDLGLPFGRRTMTYNSRKAQELGKWAETQGAGEAYHRAVFHAYFADGRNIGQLQVLQQIVAAIGLDPHQAAQVLTDGTCKAGVDEDWRRARQMAVNAVPTFHLNGRFLVGAQPYDALRSLMLAARVPLGRKNPPGPASG